MAGLVRRAGAAVLALALAAGLAGAAQVPVLNLDPNAAAPGEEVTAVGRSFPAGAEVRLHLDDIDEPPLVTVTVPRSGSFQATFTVPDGAEPGPHQVIACRPERSSCVRLASADLRVLDKPPPPPQPPPPPPAPPPPAPPPGAPPPPPAPPSVPGDLQASEDPTCCDPTAPSGPGQIAEPPAPPAPPPLGNPQGGPGDQEVPDLYVRAIEVTQNIQDLQSRMPLVADRRTWIRVHPRVVHSDQAVDTIGGAVLLRRGGDETILYPRNLTASIGPGIDRTDPDSALNFLVPPDWDDSGSLLVRALIWDTHPSTLDEEANPDNNMLSTSVTFHDGVEPIVHVLPLDDGGGPGPPATTGLAVEGLLKLYLGLLTYHPIADAYPVLHPEPLFPGPETKPPLTDMWILEYKRGRSLPLKRMFWYHQLLGLPAAERIFGIFDSSIPADGYLGWAGSSYRSTWIKPIAGTAAHEGGHLAGLRHVDCTGGEEAGGALDPTYPNAAPDCSLAPVDETGYYGFTVLRSEPVVYSNDPAHPAAAFPLMSYETPSWSDPYHYCRMLEFYGIGCSPSEIGVPGILVSPPEGHVDCTPELGPGGITLELCLKDNSPPLYDDVTDIDPDDIHLLLPQQPDAWVLIAGEIDNEQQTVAIDQAAWVEELSGSVRAVYDDYLEAVRAGAGTGGASIRMAGATGLVMPMMLDLDTGHGPEGADPDEEGDVQPFVQVVPITEDVTELEIVAEGWDGATTVPISATAPAPPQLDIGSWSAAEGLEVSWSSEDPDGDSLTATVLWSADGGQWHPVVIGTTETAVTVPPAARFPGGSVRIKVQVNDGVRTSEAVSEPVAVPGQQPLPIIAGVADGATIARYGVVELRSVSQDPEDGVLDEEALSWTSDLDGGLGTGRRVTTGALSTGDHVVMLTATDSDGAVATTEVTLTVVDTGAAAPLTEGAIPDAERRLRAGSATLPGSRVGPLALAAFGLAGLAAVLGAVLLLRRRWPLRPRSRSAPPTTPG